MATVTNSLVIYQGMTCKALFNFTVTDPSTGVVSALDLTTIQDIVLEIRKVVNSTIFTTFKLSTSDFELTGTPGQAELTIPTATTATWKAASQQDSWFFDLYTITVNGQDTEKTPFVWQGDVEFYAA